MNIKDVYVYVYYLPIYLFSDNTLKVWETESTKCIGTLEGHESRIWDVSSNKNGTLVSSSSGDSTVRVSVIFFFLHAHILYNYLRCVN